MVGNFMDEIDCGSFFDHIDDLLDFPSEDIEVDLPKGNCDSLPTIWQAQSDSLPGSDSVFSGNAASDISAELYVPYEDIVQLEWLSNFCEDSFSDGGLTIKKEESSNKEDSSHNQFQTSSPISVLESSSSCSADKGVSSSAAPHSPETTNANRCGRARSKRPRPASFSPRQAIEFISLPNPMYEPPELIDVPKASSESKSFAESRTVIKIPKRVVTEHKKKKKMKLSVPLASAENHENQNQSTASQPVRKCMHCEITKTPQWRAGPMGPKTLCNACGVRYKSGRLFPEYRPAASPTFVPSLHSNSHKKVLEMRNKSIEGVASVSQVAMNAPESPVLIPNNYISQDLQLRKEVGKLSPVMMQ